MYHIGSSGCTHSTYDIPKDLTSWEITNAVGCDIDGIVECSDSPVPLDEVVRNVCHTLITYYKSGTANRIADVVVELNVLDTINTTAINTSDELRRNICRAPIDYD